MSIPICKGISHTIPGPVDNKAFMKRQNTQFSKEYSTDLGSCQYFIRLGQSQNILHNSG